jgi:hypothetical protein
VLDVELIIFLRRTTVQVTGHQNLQSAISLGSLNQEDTRNAYKQLDEDFEGERTAW